MAHLGCAFATLNNVVQQERPATPEEIQRVQIVRQGQRLSTQAPMNLQQGDELTTDAETTVVINFATGTEVILWPNTRVSLSSIRAFLGEIYVKARGLFRVETTYAVAGTEGTEFLTTVGHNNDVSVIVVEGVVRIESTRQLWSPLLLQKAEQATLVGSQAPQRQAVPQDKLDEIRRRVARLSRLTPEAEPPLVAPVPLRLPFDPGPRLPPRDSGGRGSDLPGQPGGGSGSPLPSRSPNTPK
jgi:hypothetical protein